MDFRHISHGKQQNKPHARAKSVAGKVENLRGISSGATQLESSREQRFNRHAQLRKQKREEMLMKRRGLNFVTEHHEENLDEQSIQTVESEVDNIAPKIVGILGLSACCDTKAIRDFLVEHCNEYTDQLREAQVTKKEVKEAAKQEKQNEDMDAEGSKENQQKKVESDSEYKAYICPNAGASGIAKKQRLIFRIIDREDVYSVLDVGKVADIVLMVMSCKDTDESSLNNPDKLKHEPIDEQGYRALNLLRAQATMSLVGVLQHIECISSKRQPQAKKLFLRYFFSEFQNQSQFMVINKFQKETDVNALLRQIAVTYPKEITWRNDRSYMLAEVADIDRARKRVQLHGYIRNNCLNIKRLIHLTGVTAQQGFKIKQIEIASDPCPLKLSRGEIERVKSTSKAQSIMSSRAASRAGSLRGSRSGSFDGDDPTKQGAPKQAPVASGGKIINKLVGGEKRDDAVMELAPAPFQAEQTYLTEQDINESQQPRRKGSYDEMDQAMQNEPDHDQIDSSKIKEALAQKNVGKEPNQLEGLFDKLQITVVGRENEDNKSQASFEDEDSEGATTEQQEEDHFQEDPNKISQKHQKHTDMEAREREDMDFPDEVDTPLLDARKRFQKYRGIKSLKNCDWDPYENLPVEYAKIFRFQNIQGELKQQLDNVRNEGLPINGTYICLLLEVENEEAFDQIKQLSSKGIIASTLFPHECKVSAMHFKVQRTLENGEVVPSKALMEFSCGFRRLSIRPSFSMELNAAGRNDKLKYMRFLRKDMYVIASAYCPISYPGTNLICFTKRVGEPVSMDMATGGIVASGVALPPDPLKIILKRIILTGYPLRCHKKKATIRYMFFDPKDIKYFRPVELYTANGLRGRIRDSLGTHGLMKCHYNDFIKQDDTVCMPLYRRVFPKWHESTWNPSAAASSLAAETTQNETTLHDDSQMDEEKK